MTKLIVIEELPQLENVLSASKHRPVLIFKHSAT